MGGSVRYSGILVSTRPADVRVVASRLSSLPGVEVHQRHVPSGRIVILYESPEIEEHEAILRRITGIPSVLSAGLVRHVLDAEAPPAPGSDPGGEGQEGV
jgi:nitrate reductase NapAB chaperone NapD